MQKENRDRIDRDPSAELKAIFVAGYFRCALSASLHFIAY